MSPHLNPYTMHCPRCNSLQDWQAGTPWKPCTGCAGRGILTACEVTFPA